MSWWRDLANPAGALTLSRAPLAVIAPFVADRPRVLLGLYLFGVATDVVDGVVARRTGTTSQAGAYADSILDKVFNAVFTLVLVFGGHVPGWWILPWFLRDFLQAALIAAFYRDAFAYEDFERDANAAGKATTVLLGVTIAAVLLGYPRVAGWLTAAVAVTGLISGVGYGLREWRLRHPVGGD